MSNIIFSLLAAIIGLSALRIILSKLFSKKGISDPYDDFPYEKREYFFTKAEFNFYKVLKLALKDSPYIIFSKVRLLDLLYVPSDSDNKTVYKNKIQAKHVDFVICDDRYIRPLLVIELDDSSHLQEKRILRDEFVDNALENAGLQIIHIRVQASYNVNNIRELIDHNIAMT